MTQLPKVGAIHAPTQTQIFPPGKAPPEFPRWRGGGEMCARSVRGALLLLRLLNISEPADGTIAAADAPIA